MGAAIGDMLPAAVAVAISPLPIIAIVLILVSARGRANGLAYLTGQIVGVVVAGAILLAIAGSAGAKDEGQPAGWVNWLKLLLGLVLVALAFKQWRARPTAGEKPETPTWMGALDEFTPLKAAGAGAALAAINPKNLILIVAGMAAIAETGIPTGEQAVALIVFTMIASLGVAIPVVLSFALGERSHDLLNRLKTWMAANSAVIMAVVLILIAAKLIGDAIAGFSG
jgi:threonine/homoserine/homoserine lactone efflux protein